MTSRVVSIRADLESLSDDGLIQASRRYVGVEWYPLDVGAPVFVEDPDGSTCYGVVVRADGLAIDIKPSWDTCKAGPRARLRYTGQIVERERTQAAL